MAVVTEKSLLLEDSKSSSEDESSSLSFRGRYRYGSTPSSFLADHRKMAARHRGLVDENGVDPHLGHSSETDTSDYRRITYDSAYVPPIRRTWRESFKRLVLNLYNLNFRRVSSLSNVVHTTKYTLITFLPKNLLEQFHRVANLYFLLIIILNFIPAIEAFGKEVSWVPLFCVLSVTAIKDAIEDIRRYLSDRKVNATLCEAYNRIEGQFTRRKWEELFVGDFVRLSCDEVIPADLLILESSDPNNSCYIQTSNLDGETTLKQRQVPEDILESREPHADFFPEQFSGKLFYEQPNKTIYEFKGFVEKPDGSHIFLNRNHLLLRGCVLRNTDYIIGMILYAGYETKSMLNNTGHRAKRSKLERAINAEVVSQFAILFVLCLVGAIRSSLWTGRHINRNIVYFPFTSSNANPSLEGFVRFWTFVIAFQVIIPVSLYITIEIVKICQIIFITWDMDMYHEETQRGIQCKALNITEDLGQIEHVFTDKTGTLTENEMIFRCCTIAGSNYPHGLEFGSGLIETQLSLNTMLEGTDYPNHKSKLILDSQLKRELSHPKSSSSFLNDFLINMAVCNTVVVAQRTTSTGGKDGPPEIIYEAESSDEYALVEAARAYGYILLSRSPTLIRLQTPHQGILELDLLHVFEFSPDRKRMSVIVRLTTDGEDPQIVLYTKGADSVLYGLLDYSLSEETSAVTQDLLNKYGRLGLRTLCLTKRVISEDEYQVWAKSHQKAERDLGNRDTLLQESYSNIEKHLQLLGATGIEDRLQSGVPDTIQALREAGIIIWILTGDKKETAINIGYSSKLLEHDTEIVFVHAQSEEQCLSTLTAIHQDRCNGDARGFATESGSSYMSHTVDMFRNQWFKLKNLSHSQSKGPPLSSSSSSKAIVIDGETLALALHDSSRKLFVSICKEFDTVICCRATPLQKAGVVQLYKESGVMTLAIGDGANDVSMIQQANVGIGIAGKEGMQAVLASDFNMARFSYLKKLLLVHGHWCYTRLANLILYFFYKNVMFSVLLFWFQIFNGFSGSIPIEGVNLQIYNLVYTSLPVMVAGTADQDVKANTLLSDSSLYNVGRCSQVYTRSKYWLIMLEAFYQSAVVFFIPYAALYGGTIGLVEFGFIINTIVVIVASLHLAIETLHWTWIHHFFLWGSCLVLFVFNYVYCAINTQQRFMDTYFIMQAISTLPSFWFLLILTPMVALLPRLVGKVLHQDLFPDPVMKARKDEKKKAKNMPIKEDSASGLFEAEISNHQVTPS